MKAKGSMKGRAPERWSRGAASGDAAQDQLAELMRAGDPVVAFGAARRARVLRRLRLAGPSRWVGVRFPVLRWALAAVVLMTSGGVITAATMGKWWAPLFRDQDRVTPPAEPARKVRPTRRDKSVRVPGVDQSVTTADQEAVETSALPPVVPQAESATPPPVPPPAVQTAPASSPVALAAPIAPVLGRPRALALVTPIKRQPVRPVPSAPVVPAASSPTPAVSPMVPAAPTDLQDESRLLGRAVMRLRQAHDARGALATVDDYRTRFPDGMLTREASIVQVDALLMLKRGDEALELLRGLALQAQGRDQELRLIRGELSATRDCRGAMADFDRILLQGPREALLERALHGRAACRLRLGDVDGAVADLDLYLRQYPNGRFAAEARRAKAMAMPAGGR